MIFRRIGRVFRRAVNFAKDAFKTISKPLSKILDGPLGGLVGKLLDKLPLPKFVTGLVNKFMNSPFAALLPGPLGAIGALLQKASSVGDIVDIVRGTTNSQAFQGGPPAARNNIFQMAAARHAQIAFPGMFG